MHMSAQLEDQPPHMADSTLTVTLDAPGQTLNTQTSHLKPADAEFEPLSLAVPAINPYRPHSPAPASITSVDDGLSRTISNPPVGGWKGKVHASWVRNKGIFMMLCAQFFGTLMNVTTRLLETEGNKGKGLHPFQILFARMGITFVLASAYMYWKKTPYFPFGRPEVRWLLVARGLFGFWGVFGMYYSLLYLPLADATVITFLAPALACWACAILINQPFTRREQLAALVSLVGVIIIARPTSLFATSSNSEQAPPGHESATPSNSSSVAHGHATDYDHVTPMERLSAVGIALIGVLGATGAYTTIRWIGQRAHPLISVNYFAFWCFLVSIFMQVALPDVDFLLPADLKEWGYLLFLGTCGFIMQFLLAAGLSYEKSSRTTNMVYTQMLFALLFDKLIFNHTPGAMSILGSSLILGSAITIALQQSAPASASKPDISTRCIDTTDEESQQGLLHDMDNPTVDVPRSVPEGQTEAR